MKNDNNYLKYKDDLLYCPFCHKSVNLFYAKPHLKTSSCRKIQEIYVKKDEYEVMLLKFLHQINELRSNIRYEPIE